ncbi:HU family DNA-binding protein [Clostridium sp. MB40-C1]|uniref:HU family DNA-binding protein n=1 Tax=Clostridium sp. MB40-C1 TaxID=3070996 RepID=UPI0027E148E3|nr:HU family DNA-binding protein [Clostridium sp. MB40-C1]WMJ80260.1 HU family DNA-binding protein [Clostridium sp. MB40-C1]
MNKAELIASMSEKTQLTKKDAEAALKAFIESVEEALGKGEKVQLIGFGTFETRERAERKGRNPRTKEEIVIPASTVPVFKAGKEFKDIVNNK